jgi:hypothetical protein
MKGFNTILKNTKFAIVFLLLVLIAGGISQVFAHGGEDHGDAKPKTETSGAGTVSHSSRLGELEVMLKHPDFAPDTATGAKLFITKFDTNQGFAEVSPAVEIESANGAVTNAKIEKTETPGVFSVAIPALPAGKYTVRAKLTHGGETDTATFSGVEVATAPAESIENGGMSWARTALIALIFLIVVGLLGGLAFFVLRVAAGEPLKEETVSA